MISIAIIKFCFFEKKYQRNAENNILLTISYWIYFGFCFKK